MSLPSKVKMECSCAIKFLNQSTHTGFNYAGALVRIGWQADWKLEVGGVDRQFGNVVAESTCACAGLMSLASAEHDALHFNLCCEG